MKSSTSKVLQLLLRFLVVVGVARFLIATTAAAGNTKHHELERNMGGREKNLSKFDLNYVSKRRIPNGPDPIHNRRTGSSRQPPGQA
ncbi:hypothetical protein C2S53_003829 [Perilla frutescens var. hirtella]|uniref:CLAVATA3/ESR (CLE)-related protein 25 n=1 Tax=Perilla frutescens var. hirtella TaxID=608512 RepID=A0AAD4IW41_PERFH|nr:hypothetical protein C2S53_003829 [Perilla frutescens var. hirtella]